MEYQRDTKSRTNDVDFYELLGVKSGCTEKELKDGYNKMVLKYHPDKHPDKPQYREVYEMIVTAYQILSNPATRKDYDNLSSLSRQSSSSFVGLKENYKKYNESQDVRPATDQDKLIFSEKMLELNKKHGFDPDDAKKSIPKDVAKKSYQELLNERTKQEKLDTPENLFRDKPFDLKIFNEAFDKLHGKPGSKDIISTNGIPSAWNSIGMTSSTSYTSYDKMDVLYEDENNNFGLDGQTFSGVAFGEKPQIKLTVDDLKNMTGADYVDGHNKLGDDYISDLKTRLKEREMDSDIFMSRKKDDFKRDDFSGYGIFEQLGISEPNMITFDDMEDINEKYDKLMASRGGETLQLPKIKENIDSSNVEDRYQKMLQERQRIF